MSTLFENYVVYKGAQQEEEKMESPLSQVKDLIQGHEIELKEGDKKKMQPSDLFDALYAMALDMD